MPNKYDFLSFDGLPAAKIVETDNTVKLTASAIPGVDEGQEVVFFVRTLQGNGIAIYLTLQKENLKKSMELELDKSQLPKSKELYIDYGAYVNQRSVHRSAVACYPADATAAGA
nr:hypothetical protein [uncultured Pseudomonas sp.]